MLLAKGFQPGGFFCQDLPINPLRHEQDPTAIDFWDLFQVIFDFRQVVRGIDDEFDLIRVVEDKLPDDCGAITSPFVGGSPTGMIFPGRRRIAELGTDRSKMAHHRQIARPRGFNCDVITVTGQIPSQLHDTREEHWFAARENNMSRGEALHPSDDFFYRKMFPFNRPTGVRRVAEPAAEVTSGSPYENTLRARQESLSLPRLKNLGNADPVLSLRPKSHVVNARKYTAHTGFKPTRSISIRDGVPQADFGKSLFSQLAGIASSTGPTIGQRVVARMG